MKIQKFKDFNLTETNWHSMPELTHGQNLVNIIVGRFQPFTEGHLKMIQEVHNENGLPIVILLVRSAKVDLIKKPLTDELTLEILNEVQKRVPFIKDILTIKMAGIDSILSALRPKYEPVLWAAGTDAVTPYQNQITRYGLELNVLPNFTTYEIKRNDGDISATKVREAVKDNNVTEFKKMMPTFLHEYFNEIQKNLKF